MEASSHRQLWLECLGLKERGYFHRAQKKLIELLELEQGKSSRILIELADTLCQQGMYAMAFERVDSHLVERTEEDDSGVRGAIRMIRAFCRAHAQAIFQDGLEMIQDYEGIRAYGTKPGVADVLVSSPLLLAIQKHAKMQFGSLERSTDGTFGILQ